VDDEPAADTVEFLAGAAGSFAAGARVAGYRVERQLGQGGMAVVYLARDERLDRRVALKVLAPALASDEEFRRRFIRESRAAAAVDDPHIIPVFDAGETDGLLYIAMRYVPAGDVLTIMNDDGLLPPGRAAAVISQVASALDAAHAAGLVHRDVKPANMLVDVRPGRPDHVYLSDFGLSKKTLTTSVGLTRKGQFLGTPDYTAPEQIQGKPADGRTDQYGLACAAFELLTGAPPFRREEPTAVMYAHLSEPPPSATSRRADLPVGVDQVLARALAKAPADRYPSCQGFADALLQALGTAPHQVSLQTAEDPIPDHPPTQTDWVGARGTGQQPMPTTDSAGDIPSPPPGGVDMQTRDADVPTPSADDPDGSMPVPSRSTPRGSSQKAREAAGNGRPRVGRLITDAERIAQSITSESSKANALAGVATALAATDPDRAERIAQSITSESSKAKVLAEVAAALAATDPDRATRLVADADHIARSITDKSEKATALAGVATALAATDPDRAERIARSITNEYFKAKVLAEVATALAATDPDRAEHTARSIVGESYEVSALANLAKALAATDPPRAHPSGNPGMRVWRLRAVVAAIVMVVFSVLVSWKLGLTLAMVFVIADIIYRSRRGHSGQGRAWRTGAQRAARLIDDAERIAQSITNKYWKASALAAVATALAATDPDRAEHIARSITTESSKATALAEVATALAVTDPDRAERIARSITDELWKARALVMIAEA
jgi:serine/threonine protein kinase